MEILREENGWKLGKRDNLCYLICPSGEERPLNTRWADHCANTFNHAVRNNWTWLERVYYIPSVVKNKVTVSKNKKNIRSDKVALFDRTHCTTEAQARLAINDVMPQAEAHFKECKQKYLDLLKSLQFSVGFNYEGDTHGIYNEYEYISFKMNSFAFQFSLDS
jgi:hypothetical protein